MGWTSVISDGRRKAKEDRDSAYEAEIRRRKIAELQRLDEIRKLKESRRPTYISDFGQDEQTNTQTNTQANTQTNTQADTQADTQATYGQIPEFNLDTQNKLATERDAAILQRGKDYDTAVANENLRQSGVNAARGKLLELQAAQKGKGSEQYLPELRADSSSFAQMRNDVQLANELNDAAYTIEHGAAPTGAYTELPDFITDTFGNIKNYFTSSDDPTAIAKADADLAALREARDWYESGVFSKSPSELYFINNPDKWTEAKSYEGGYLKYYIDKVKPLIESGGISKDSSSKKVHTKEQIAEAEAKHKDYMSKIATGINTLDDDIANAPAFMEKLNKDKKVSEKELQDLYKDQLTESNAAQLAKVFNTKIDPSLLDPRQLGGLVKQHYQQRQLLKYKAQHARKVAERSGDWTEYDTLRAEISEKDVSIYEAIGHQGISDLKLNNDPRRISAVLSKFANTKTIVQPRSDGNYNIITNGKLSGKPRTAAEIRELVQMYSSPTFRAQSAEYDKKQTEHQIEGQETPKSKAENETSIIKAYLTEVIKGSNEQDKLALEQRLKGREVKFSSSGGDSGGFLTTTDGTTILYNPTPGTSPSGTRLSEFTDISSQIPRAIFPAIRNGTIDFNKAEFWKEIGLPNPLLNK